VWNNMVVIPLLNRKKQEEAVWTSLDSIWEPVKRRKEAEIIWRSITSKAPVSLYRKCAWFHFPLWGFVVRLMLSIFNCHVRDKSLKKTINVLIRNEN
jgi:hypothetical protein